MIDKMFCLAEVFLRCLKFGQNRSLFYASKKRMKRFARLKINRTVLRLHHDVGTELTVKPCKLYVSALDTIRVHVLVINKGAPDYNAAVRRECICEHVGAFSMGAAVILWAGLTF